jgi:Domain of unknown function (DUF4286)
LPCIPRAQTLTAQIICMKATSGSERTGNAVVYNLTVKVDASIATAWLTWAKADYIPSILATKLFDRAVVLRLLEVDETDGPTYAVQFFANDHSFYEEYRNKHEDKFIHKARQKWGDSFVSFGSVLQVVN